MHVRRFLDPFRDFRPAGLVFTLLVLHCAACRRLSVHAVDGVCLRRGKQRALLRADSIGDWPAFRCPYCESADLTLVEDV